jgi:hypothetical protein
MTVCHSDVNETLCKGVTTARSTNLPRFNRCVVTNKSIKIIFMFCWPWPIVVCAAPPEDGQVVLETSRDCQFITNWIKCISLVLLLWYKGSHSSKLISPLFRQIFNLDFAYIDVIYLKNFLQTVTNFPRNTLFSWFIDFNKHCRNITKLRLAHCRTHF